MGDPHRVQGPLELALPEIEEFVKAGKIGCQIVMLPDKKLQQRWLIRHPVVNFGRGQTIAADLTKEVSVHNHKRTFHAQLQNTDLPFLFDAALPCAPSC